MIKLPLNKKKHRITQKHLANQDATDIQKKTLFFVFISLQISPRNRENASLFLPFLKH